MVREAIGQTIVAIAVEALLLFGAAGTLDWRRGWVFLGVFTLCNLAFAGWLLAIDRDLLRQRMASPFAAGQTRRDGLVMAAIVVFFCGWFVLMAVDARRFGWSTTPPWAQALGVVLLVVAYVGWAGVMRANTFAVPTIRLQAERDQTVISTGPYAVVRHPMYAYVPLLLVAVPLMLGSLWGLLGLFVCMPLLAARLRGEEAGLMEGLPGYRAYAERVRYRLLPGIW